MAHPHHDPPGARTAAADDVRLRRFMGDDNAGAGGGDCAPPMDVLETATGVEIVVDLPGVAAASVQLVFADGTLLVAGQKLPAPCSDRQATFHLAERTFGRFARAVHVRGAFDAGRASATLRGGELRIVLPRIEERRGREIRIQVAAS